MEVLREKNIGPWSLRTLAAMLLARRDALSRRTPDTTRVAEQGQRKARAAVRRPYRFLRAFLLAVKGVDLYFSPGKARSGLKANGVDPARMVATGIPVPKEFLAREAGKKKELGLSRIFHVAAGGSKAWEHPACG